MKKRTAVIAALLSLLPLGQTLVIGKGAVLTSAAVLLSIPEKAQAETAVFYYNRGIEKQEKGDYYGAISDYSKAIEIKPNYVFAYSNRGLAKKLIGDMKGACSDWRTASSLGNQESASRVRNQCQ